MADSNVATKKYLTHEVLGNKRMDVVEYTVSSTTTGATVTMRLHKVEAANVQFIGVEGSNYATILNVSPGLTNTVASGAAGWPTNMATSTKVVVTAFGW